MVDLHTLDDGSSCDKSEKDRLRDADGTGRMSVSQLSADVAHRRTIPMQKSALFYGSWYWKGTEESPQAFCTESIVASL